MGVSEREGEENGATSPADLVEQPAKVMRIGSMIKQLLEEVRNAPLDEAGRARLAEIHQPLDRRAEAGPRPRADRGAGPDRAAVPGRGALRRRAADRPGPARRLARGALPRHPDRARSPSRWRRRRSCSRCARCRPGTRRTRTMPVTRARRACRSPAPAGRAGVHRRGRHRPVPLTGRRPVRQTIGEPPVTRDDLGGDVARLLRGQEDVGRCQLGRLRRPAQRRLLAERGHLLLVHRRRDQRGPDRARARRALTRMPFSASSRRQALGEVDDRRPWWWRSRAAAARARRPGPRRC